MVLEEFLSLPNPETYDFKRAYNDEKYNVDNYETHLERFFHYKTDSPNQFDADGSGTNSQYVSALLRSVYKELFLWNYAWDEKHCSRYAPIEGIHGMIWGPDAMNTFMTAPLPQFLSETDILADYKKQEFRQKYISSYMLYQVIIKDVLNKTDATFDRKSGLKYYLADNDYAEWEHLAGWIHTLGNFVLVPAGFNPERAKLFDDYWDTSLQYLSIDPWAASGIFNWYINHFFLWDYVDKIGNTYRVKSLFNPDFLKCKPQEWHFDGQVRYSRHTQSEIKVWIENVSFAIKRRGRLMVALLKLKSKDENLYKSLQADYFDSNKAIGSMEEVVNALGERIQDVVLLDEFKACLK